MMYLVDTNVISELRKAHRAEPRVVEWARNREPQCMYVAMRCAELHVPDPRSDRDALIAATALTHKMSVVTRNCKDFEPMGVPIINPWTC